MNKNGPFLINYSIVSSMRFKIIYRSQDNSLKEQNSIKKELIVPTTEQKEPKAQIEDAAQKPPTYTVQRSL